MRKAELLFGLGVLFFGGLFLEESLRLPYFVNKVPGPGFLPVWLSLGIIAMGLGLTIPHFRPSSASPLTEQKPTGSGAWQRVGMIIGGLAVVTALLKSLGFLITTILYVGLVAFGLGMRSLRVLVAVSMLTGTVLYGVFVVLLEVEMPVGFLSVFGW